MSNEKPKIQTPQNQPVESPPADSDMVVHPTPAPSPLPDPTPEPPSDPL